MKILLNKKHKTMNKNFSYFFKGTVTTLILCIMVAPFITKLVFYPGPEFKTQIAPAMLFYMISIIIGAGVALMGAFIFLPSANKEKPSFVEPVVEKHSSPPIKPRLLPIDSKVLTTYGTGYVKIPTKLGYHNVKITNPSEGCERGFYQVEDKDLIKILRMAEF